MRRDENQRRGNRLLRQMLLDFQPRQTRNAHLQNQAASCAGSNFRTNSSPEPKVWQLSPMLLASASSDSRNGWSLSIARIFGAAATTGVTLFSVAKRCHHPEQFAQRPLGLASTTYFHPKRILRTGCVALRARKTTPRRRLSTLTRRLDALIRQVASRRRWRAGRVPAENPP